MLEHAYETEPAARESNDAVLIRTTPEGALLAVADGAGGLPGGRVAADTCLELLEQRVQPGLDAVDLPQVFFDIDHALSVHRQAGETTLVVCIVRQGSVHGASVGDSGAWLLTPELDDLTSRQQRKPRLGSGASVPTPFGPTRFDGTLLLASDGLFKYASRETIARRITGLDLTVVASDLVDAARMRNGELQDDTTVVLARPSG